MSELEPLMSIIILLYLPFGSFLLATVSFIIGLFLKFKKLKSYKKLFVMGRVFFAISIIVHFTFYFAVMFYGIGPGMSE